MMQGAGTLRRLGTVIVYGSSGFVGREVARCMATSGVTVLRMATPRLLCSAADVEVIADSIDQTLVGRLRIQLARADVVVNASGVTPRATHHRDVLLGANALFPATLASATAATGTRLIHVSSAAVQGNQPRLTARGPLRPFNPYSASKAMGETLVTRLAAGGAVCLRPASVHGVDRSTTRKVVAFARSPVAFTETPGAASTPQQHVVNVAAAVHHLASTRSDPPSVVLQPDEGFTTGGFLELMGSGRSPRLVPRSAGWLTVGIGAATSVLLPQAAQHVRRLEILLRGQEQEASWLDGDNFKLPYSHAEWTGMVRDMEAEGAAR